MMAESVWWLLFMQEIRSSNPPVAAGICDFNKTPARHHLRLKLGSKLKYLKHSLAYEIETDDVYEDF